MATLTINKDYSVSDGALVIPLSDGSLKIEVPTDGCLICVAAGDRRKRFAAWLKSQTIIDLTGFRSKTKWTYDVYSYETGACPTEKPKLGAHSIQVGD